MGQTNSGKSTVLRAFNLISTNRWHKGYVRHGRKAVKVVLYVDGHKVVRKKGKGVNTWSLDGKVFHSDLTSKNQVPPEIAKLLNVSQDNFQRQLDLHFWFHDTPGSLSRKLNEIVNLERIDAAMANVAAEVRGQRAKEQVTLDRLRTARQEAKDLAWVREFDEDLQELERLETAVQEKTATLRSVEFLAKRLSELTDGIRNRSQIVLDAKSVLAAGASAEKATREYKAVATFARKLREVDALARTEVPDFSELEKVRTRADKVAEECSEAEALAELILEQEDFVCRAEKELRARQAKLSKLTKGRCPACGQKVKKTSLPSSVRTYTSATPARSPVPRRTIGTPSKVPF